MSRIETVTLQRFPRQNDDLGSEISIMLSPKEYALATVVRSDAERPFRTIYRTADGQYLSASEIGSFASGEQDWRKGREVEVFIDRRDNPQGELGTLVRSDEEDPFATFIELPDGRIFTNEEYGCFCLHHEHPRENLYIARLTAELGDLPLDKRPVFLRDEIYPQLVPDKPGDVVSGAYSNLRPNTEELTVDRNSPTAALAKNIAAAMDAIDFIDYVAEQMEQHGLHGHAKNLRNL